jgi:predicted alpha/beta hydrolase family esterase
MGGNLNIISALGHINGHSGLENWTKELKLPRNFAA